MITKRELEKLRVKAIAHDDYLIAMKRLAHSRASIRRLDPVHGMADFALGYERAIEDLAQHIADAMRDRLIEAESVCLSRDQLTGVTL